MAQSLAQIYIHIAFHVHDKNINREHLCELWAYIAGIAKGMQSNVVVVGGEPDHIHMLCTLPRKVTVSDLMEEVKRNSSKWIKTISPHYRNFSWQRGYGVFSVSQSQLETVRNYIVNQEEHHRKKTFKEEFVEWLDAYQIEYDSKYLFSD